MEEKNRFEKVWRARLRNVKRPQSLGMSGWASAPTTQAPIKSTAMAAAGETSMVAY